MADCTYPLDSNSLADLFEYTEQDYLEEEAEGRVDIPYDHPAALLRYKAMYRLMDLFNESLEDGSMWPCLGSDEDRDQQFCELLDELDERDCWQKEVQCWKESQDDESDNWDWWWRQTMAEQAAIEKLLARHMAQELRQCSRRCFAELNNGRLKKLRNRPGVGARKQMGRLKGNRKSCAWRTPPKRVIVGNIYPSQEELFESYLDDESAMANAESQHEDDKDESRGEAREWKFGPSQRRKSAVMCQWERDVHAQRENSFLDSVFDQESECDQRDPFGARLRMGLFAEVLREGGDRRFDLDPDDEDKDVSGPELCRNISVVAASFEVDDADATGDPRRFQGGHTLRSDSGGGYRNRYTNKPGVGVTRGAHRGPLGVRRAMRVSLLGAF